LQVSSTSLKKLRGFFGSEKTHSKVGAAQARIASCDSEKSVAALFISAQTFCSFSMQVRAMESGDAVRDEQKVRRRSFPKPAGQRRRNSDANGTRETAESQRFVGL
jgi:hypothetical protein